MSSNLYQHCSSCGRRLWPAGCYGLMFSLCTECQLRHLARTAPEPHFRVTITETYAAKEYSLTTGDLTQRQVNNLISVISQQLAREGWQAPVRIEVRPEMKIEVAA